MTDLGSRWLSRAAVFVGWSLLASTVLCTAGKLDGAQWVQVHVILVPAFLALNGVEKWRGNA